MQSDVDEKFRTAVGQNGAKRSDSQLIQPEAVVLKWVREPQFWNHHRCAAARPPRAPSAEWKKTLQFLQGDELSRLATVESQATYD